MSDRRAIAACIAMLLGATTAGAQSRAAAERRLDSLTTILSTTPGPVRPKPLAKPSGAGVVAITFDTLPGVLPFIVASNARKFAEPAMRAADAQIRRALGPAPSFLGKLTLNIVAKPAPGGELAVHVTLHSVDIGGLTLAGSDSASITAALLEAAGALVPNRADLRMVNWIARTAIAFDSLRSADWVAVWMDATRVPNQSVADCLAGNIPVCMTALDVVPPRDTIPDWIDSARVREIVQAERALLRREAPEETAACEKGVFAACRVILRVVPFHVHPPMPGTARASLARFAIVTGGEGAATRLIQSQGTIAERLAATAGIPAEELVRRWQARLIGQRSGAAFLSADLVISAVLWTALFVALGLRSSRWR